jgi:ribonucleotide monophosphatase NagD (HAD superfamily)
LFFFYFSRKEINLNPGVFIDIDGVVLHGGKPFEFSKEAIHVSFIASIHFVKARLDTP